MTREDNMTELETHYKIERQRQGQAWWTDITMHYACDSRFSAYEEALENAKIYKSQHKSDKVRIVRVVTSAEEVS